MRSLCVCCHLIQMAAQQKCPTLLRQQLPLLSEFLSSAKLILDKCNPKQARCWHPVLIQTQAICSAETTNKTAVSSNPDVVTSIGDHSVTFTWGFVGSFVSFKNAALPAEVPCHHCC